MEADKIQTINKLSELLSSEITNIVGYVALEMEDFLEDLNNKNDIKQFSDYLIFQIGNHYNNIERAFPGEANLSNEVKLLIADYKKESSNGEIPDFALLSTYEKFVDDFDSKKEKIPALIIKRISSVVETALGEMSNFSSTQQQQVTGKNNPRFNNIITAIKNGDLSAIKAAFQMIENGQKNIPLDINQTLPDGRTCLDVAKECLDETKNSGKKDEDVITGRTEIISFLEDKGATISEAAKEAAENTKKIMEMHELLVKNETVNWKEVNQYNEENKPDINTKFELQVGNNTTIKTTLLISAAFHGKLGVVKFLLNKGANVNRVDNMKNTAAHRALLQGGSQHNDRLIRGKFTDIAIEIMERQGTLALNRADREYGQTLLHYAAQYGFLEVAEYLLQKGVEPSPVDKKGNTPLSIAVDMRDLRITNLLLDNGAEVTSKLRDKISRLATPTEEKLASIKLAWLDVLKKSISLSKNQAKKEETEVEAISNQSMILQAYDGISALINNSKTDNDDGVKFASEGDTLDWIKALLNPEGHQPTKLPDHLVISLANLALGKQYMKIFSYLILNLTSAPIDNNSINELVTNAGENLEDVISIIKEIQNRNEAKIQKQNGEKEEIEMEEEEEEEELEYFGEKQHVNGKTDIPDGKAIDSIIGSASEFNNYQGLNGKHIGEFENKLSHAFLYETGQMQVQKNNSYSEHEANQEILSSDNREIVISADHPLLLSENGKDKTTDHTSERTYYIMGSEPDKNDFKDNNTVIFGSKDSKWFIYTGPKDKQEIAKKPSEFLQDFYLRLSIWGKQKQRITETETLTKLKEITELSHRSIRIPIHGTEQFKITMSKICDLHDSARIYLAEIPPRFYMELVKQNALHDYDLLTDRNSQHKALTEFPELKSLIQNAKQNWNAYGFRDLNHVESIIKQSPQELGTNVIFIQKTYSMVGNNNAIQEKPEQPFFLVSASGIDFLTSERERNKYFNYNKSAGSHEFNSPEAKQQLEARFRNLTKNLFLVYKDNDITLVSELAKGLGAFLTPFNGSAIKEEIKEMAIREIFKLLEDEKYAPEIYLLSPAQATPAVQTVLKEKDWKFARKVEIHDKDALFVTNKASKQGIRSSMLSPTDPNGAWGKIGKFWEAAASPFGNSYAGDEDIAGKTLNLTLDPKVKGNDTFENPEKIALLTRTGVNRQWHTPQASFEKEFIELCRSIDNHTIIHPQPSNLATNLILRITSFDLRISHPPSTDKTDKNDFFTPLTLFARTNNEAIVNLLLEHSADVNLRDGKNHSACYYALLNKNIALAKTLFKKGGSDSASLMKELKATYSEYSRYNIVSLLELHELYDEAIERIPDSNQRALNALNQTRTRIAERSLKSFIESSPRCHQANRFTEHISSVLIKANPNSGLFNRSQNNPYQPVIDKANLIASNYNNQPCAKARQYNTLADAIKKLDTAAVSKMATLQNLNDHPIEQHSLLFLLATACEKNFEFGQPDSEPVIERDNKASEIANILLNVGLKVGEVGAEYSLGELKGHALTIQLESLAGKFKKLHGVLSKKLSTQQKLQSTGRSTDRNTLFRLHANQSGGQEEQELPALDITP